MEGAVVLPQESDRHWKSVRGVIESIHEVKERIIMRNRRTPSHQAKPLWRLSSGKARLEKRVRLMPEVDMDGAATLC